MWGTNTCNTTIIALKMMFGQKIKQFFCTIMPKISTLILIPVNRSTAILPDAKTGTLSPDNPLYTRFRVPRKLIIKENNEDNRIDVLIPQELVHLVAHLMVSELRLRENAEQHKRNDEVPWLKQRRGYEGDGTCTQKSGNANER